MSNWRNLGKQNSLKGWQAMPRSRWSIKKDKSLSSSQFILWELLISLAVWDYRKIDWLEVRESHAEIASYLEVDRSSVSRDIKKLKAVGLIIELNGRIVPVGALEMACHRKSTKELFMKAYRCTHAPNHAQNDSSLYSDFEAVCALVHQSCASMHQIRTYMRQFSLGLLSQGKYVISSISNNVTNVTNVTNVSMLTNVPMVPNTVDKNIDIDRTSANNRLLSPKDIEWLKNIPDEELEHLATVYQMEVNDINDEAYMAYNNLIAKGVSLKNYQAYFNNWLQRGDKKEWLRDTRF